MSRRVDLDLSDATRWNSGVASMLDADHRGVVSDLLDDLEAARVKVVRDVPPHFSYQTGDYEVEPLFEALAKVAAATPPFAVQTSGFGIFGGAQPVLYIPIVRTEELSRFQRFLLGAIGTACRNAADFYWLDRWVPHITLAAEGLTPAGAARAAEVLAGRTLRWTIAVDHLAYFEATYGGQQERGRFPLTG